MQKTWTQQVRGLLERAKTPSQPTFADLSALRTSIDQALNAPRLHPDEHQRRQAIPVHRKALLTAIALKNKHYGLNEETQAFIYATGAEILQQLTLQQLESLDYWLAGMIDAIQHGCDWADTPPAR